MTKRIQKASIDFPTDIKYDLVVLDVMLDMPRKRLLKPAMSSSNSSVTGSPLIERRERKIALNRKTTSAISSIAAIEEASRGAGGGDFLASHRKFVASLHRVVGVYATSEDNCPSGLDLHFFDWNSLQRIGKERSLDHLFEQPSGSKAEETMNPDVTDRSGVMTAERKISKDRTFLFKFLARNYFTNKEELEKRVPKKVRDWIGYE